MRSLNFVELNSTICRLYTQFTDNGALDWEEPDHAFYCPTVIQGRHSGYVDEKFHSEYEWSSWWQVHIIVTSRHRLYVARTKSVDVLSTVDPTTFVNLSNHDSEWKSALHSYLTKVYFEVCEDAVHKLPECLRPAPINTEVWADLGLAWYTGKVFDFVKITRGPAIPKNTYLDTLAGIKILKHKITLTEE